MTLAAVCPGAAVAQDGSGLLARGPVVIDLLGGLEWMRCSVGQVWDQNRCDGAALMAPFASADAVLQRAAASSGSGWRLPGRKELARLVETQDAPPMINAASFPQTYAGGYWTADANRLLRNRHWVVNFNTGHSYGRADPQRAYAFRLVRDR